MPRGSSIAIFTTMAFRRALWWDYLGTRVRLPFSVCILLGLISCVCVDSLTYCFTLISLLRVGYIPVIISPRNSAAAIANFLRKGNIKHFLIGREPVFEQVFRASLDILHRDAPSQIQTDPTVSKFFTYEDIFVADVCDVATDPAPFYKLEKDDLLCYFHSSG
jgi:acyl-coenzyme A synthetase/AMP-(fatty) acid ligase